MIVRAEKKNELADSMAHSLNDRLIVIVIFIQQVKNRISSLSRIHRSQPLMRSVQRWEFRTSLLAHHLPPEADDGVLRWGT